MSDGPLELVLLKLETIRLTLSSNHSSLWTGLSCFCCVPLPYINPLLPDQFS